MNPVDRPRMPTAAELRRAEAAMPGGRARLMEVFLAGEESRLAAELRREEEHAVERRRAARHRTAGLAIGGALGVGTLGVCAFAVSEGSNAAGIAAALCALVGLFVWQYAGPK